MNAHSSDVLIDCDSLWKIFGDNAGAAIRAVSERGASKAEVLREHNCVVGVAGASLQVRRGEIFCIMGLSGSGKSTLIRMLNRLIEPSLGRITVKGEDMSRLDAARLREVRARDIGMVFQSVALLPHRTVLENTGFGLEVRGVGRAERDAAARAALAKVGLAEWLDRYPSELSGGMQQRVGLARALTSDPEIILMDEPFSALDPLIRRQLQDEFRQLTKELGKSAVFITHDLDEAIRIGDRIAIMKDGAIIQTGTAEDIILNPADQYVADFVAGISRLHLVKAHSVMISPGDYLRDHPQVDLSALPKTVPEADISQLIDLVTRHDSDALTVRQADQTVGIVTTRGIMLAMNGASGDTSGVAHYG